MRRYHHILLVICGSLLIFNQTMATDDNSLVSENDLRHKIGQMLIVGFTGTTVDANSPIAKQIARGEIGGVILFDDITVNKITQEKNVSNPAQVRKLIQQLQSFAPIPLLIAIDYEGGRVARLLPEKGFPKTLSQNEVAQLNDTKAKQIYQDMAATLHDLGFNLNFAPVVDLDRNIDNLIIGQRERSYSDNPIIVSHFAAIAIDAYQQQGILTTLKHFPGHGSAHLDSHLEQVDITNSWQLDELLPYIQLFNNDPHFYQHSLVMTGHLIHWDLDPSGLPASLSYSITTELLRETLGYQGLIITDDLQMQAITDYYPLKEAVILAVNAGADLLIFGNAIVDTDQDPAEIITIITEAVKAGQIAPERIDEAYERIMGLKQLILE